MKRRHCGILLSLIGMVLSSHAATNDAPDFKEVYEVVRTHLPNLTDAELNQTAVEGFLAALRGKVTIVGETTEQASKESASPAASLLESNILWVRFSGLDSQSSSQVSEQIKQFKTSNSISGLVLDLRRADSDDYAAAAAVADLFQAKARPLLDWGKGVVQSKEKSDVVRMPIAVLVSRETGGAPEALAAILRETGVGLVLGKPTAGRAMLGQEFALKDGRRLRIASLPVKVGNGVELNTRGVQPDIAVAVSATEERLYQNDPYGLAIKPEDLADGSSTNRVRRPRTTEAALVRAHRDGLLGLDEEPTNLRDAEPAKPLIRDPVLARAVDLIKGLAVLKAAKS